MYIFTYIYIYYITVRKQQMYTTLTHFLQAIQKFQMLSKNSEEESLQDVKSTNLQWDLSPRWITSSSARSFPPTS